MKNMILAMAIGILTLTLIFGMGEFFETLKIKAFCNYVAKECAVSATLYDYKSSLGKEKIEAIISKNNILGCEYTIEEFDFNGRNKVSVEIIHDGIRGIGTHFVDKASADSGGK